MSHPEMKVKKGAHRMIPLTKVVEKELCMVNGCENFKDVRHEEFRKRKFRSFTPT